MDWIEITLRDGRVKQIRRTDLVHALYMDIRESFKVGSSTVSAALDEVLDEAMTEGFSHPMIASIISDYKPRIVD